MVPELRIDLGVGRDAHDLRYGCKDEPIRSRFETPKDGPNVKILESNWYGRLIVCVPGSTADDCFRKTK
jgi:hypothetical protein